MNNETLIKMEEKNILELYKSGESIKSLHKKFNFSERSISNYLKKHGVIIRKNSDLLNYDIIKAKKLYEEGKTLDEIANLLGCCRQSVSVQLKKIGVKVIRKNIMYDINETIFDNIITEEQSYWLGFIFADGNISNKNNYIRVNLAGKDINHLIKLKKFLNYKREINVYKTKQGYFISRLSVSNKHLWNRLNEIGCVPNKTKVLKFPIEIFNGDENLIRHFIRGYWDGDGCLTYRDKEHKRPSVNVISTNDFLREMEKHIPVTPKKTLRLKHKSNDIIRVWGKEGKTAFEVAEYLYKNSTIYLERKYDKYLEYCRLYKKL
jgi:intein-encoded DNA endonuclease-like protein